MISLRNTKRKTAGNVIQSYDHGRAVARFIFLSSVFPSSNKHSPANHTRKKSRSVDNQSGARQESMNKFR